MKGPFDTQISVYRVPGEVTNIPRGTPQARCAAAWRNALMMSLPFSVC